MCWFRFCFLHRFRIQLQQRQTRARFGFGSVVGLLIRFWAQRQTSCQLLELSDVVRVWVSVSVSVSLSVLVSGSTSYSAGIFLLHNLVWAFPGVLC